MTHLNIYEPDQSCSVETIRHRGVVSKVDDKFNYVTIIAQSACAACHASGVCNVSDLQEEIVQVPKKQGDQYTVGQTVFVKMKQSLGTLAVLLGYFFPFLLVLASLIVLLALNFSEGVAGMISLGLLIPYYLILYSRRNQLKKKFVFEIE
jgi:sigma-E factor negative regulatory protein RseC